MPVATGLPVALVIAQLRMQAVASAAKCLRPNAGLATFSPCIEQVQRTRGALAASGFWDVRVFECLLREHEVRRERMVVDVDAHPLGTNPAAAGVLSVHAQSLVGTGGA